jgi:uncharacterized protein (TIGR02117 family)
MRIVRRSLLWSVRLTAGFLIAFLVAVVATNRSGDPGLFPASGSEKGIEIVLISQGYHTGLALPRADVARLASLEGHSALINIATRFGAYQWIEIGWGEERFYMSAPTVSAPNWGLAFRALLRPGNGSVLHVVGLDAEPRALFPTSDMMRIRLSQEGTRRLLKEIDASFARSLDGPPEELGQGLYGPSLFYRAQGTFNLFNVCNHWTAQLLNAAGVPVSMALATLPDGLMLDLRLRSGLVPVPK